MIDRIDAQRIERLNAPQPEGQSAEWLDVAANNCGFFSKHDYPYVPANDKDFLGQFSIGEFELLSCGAAFRWPGQLIYAKVGSDGMIPFTRVVSYSPLPARD
jgi:hypothetical protein